MKFVKMFFALIILAVVFKFSLDNPAQVTVTIYHYITPQIPLGLLLITTFVLGMIAGAFGTTIKNVQLKHQLKTLQIKGELQGDAAPVAGKKAKKEKKAKKKDKKKDADVPSAAAVAPEATSVTTPPPVDNDVKEEIPDAEIETETVAENTVIELPAAPAGEQVAEVGSDNVSTPPEEQPVEEQKRDDKKDSGAEA